MKRKHRLIILLSIFTAMLCLMFAAASADEELHTAHVKLYIEGEFPQPGFRPFRMRGIDFDSYMRTHLANQSKQIDVSQFGMSPDEFYVSFQNMLNRSPSLFYVYGGYSYYESDDIVTSILPVYLYSGSDLTARIARFNAAVDEVVAYARQSSTIEGQLLRANDYLCANYEYDLTYSIYSPDAFFEYKTGVCQAYTMAYGAVLDKLGIAWDTTTSEEMNHIWNLVNIDDDWYHVDVTWNDPIYDVPLRVHHSNFLLSDSGIEKAGHYAWNRSITAESAKYDQYFWSSINQAIPMINDTAYYVQDPSDFSERQVYKFDLNTQKNSLVYEYAVSSSVIWGGHYPLWADNTYLYYADMNKLYRVAHSGGSASAVYDTKDSNQWIWGMFQNGTTLSMHVSPSPANKGKIHTHTISSSVQPVTITRQPVSVAVGKGQTATVSFTAAGEGLTYKWYYKDTTASDFSYSGSFTGNSYSIAISAARSGRQVYCVVTDKYGNSVQTDTVTITMADPVTITSQPVSVTVGKGQTATVSFTATGEGLTYQWYYKDTTASDFSYSGSFTGNSYSIAISAARSGRQVYCIVTDKYGNTARTDTVTITMADPVTITRQPVSVTVGKGQTATVSFAASGDGLTYKWYYKDPSSSSFLYSGSFTGNTYAIAVSAARSGRQVYCIVTDKYGNTARTNTVTISMVQPVAITSQPVSVAVNSGQSASVSFAASGDGLTYKWYFKDRDADAFRYTSSFSSNTYSVAMSAARAGRQVYCVVTDQYGNTAQTDTVTLNMIGSVQITQQPVSVTAASGARATVAFTATGDSLTYNWYYKDRGADDFLYSSSFTQNTYAITMSTARSGRQVYCEVTDKYGVTLRTDTVSLSLPGSVQITQQPASVSVPSGTTAKVTFTATGEGLTYKWYYKNKSASSFTLTTSFTGNTYSTAMTDSRAGRQIYCEVTDKYGITVRTNTVTLNMSGTPAAAGSANMIPMDLRINASLTDADIPQSLRDAGFATAQSIQDALAKRLGKTDIAGMKLYNVSLMYSEDEGNTWSRAVSEHYPEDGRITVTMPVPDGSDPTTHAYAVSHMFEADGFGKKAGGIETPEVSVFYNDKGQPMLRFETTGLSPVLVVWHAQNPQADLPATGDDSRMGLSIAVMLVSLLSLAIISLKNRKHAGI